MRRRRAIAFVTVAVIVALGAAVVGLLTVGLIALDGPVWVTVLPWLLPTIGTVVWTLRTPAPARLSDDDDDSWSGYAVRAVLVGADEPRPVATRILAAIVLGAPIVWSYVVLTALELTGLL